MTRNILDEAHIHPAIRESVANRHVNIIHEVQAAVAANDVVVVGMRQNPHPKKGTQGARRGGAALQVPRIRQLPWRVAAAQRPENVDRVADLPDGLRQGRADRRR